MGTVEASRWVGGDCRGLEGGWVGTVEALKVGGWGL